MALSVEQQILIEQRIANDGKSTLVAYILWFFFHGLGAHRFYLSHIKSASLILVMSVLGLVLALYGTIILNTHRNTTPDMIGLTVFLTGFTLLGLVFIWAVIDAFLIPGMVGRQRDALRQSLADFYKKSKK